MATLFTIEGISFRGAVIPEKKLASIWKRLTREPFPLLVAFQLGDSDFDRVMKLRKCREDDRRELEEWGRVLSARGTDACVFNADEHVDFDYVILVRKNPYHRIEECLEHELSHIAKGDL